MCRIVYPKHIDKYWQFGERGLPQVRKSKLTDFFCGSDV